MRGGVTGVVSFGRGPRSAGAIAPLVAGQMSAVGRSRAALRWFADLAAVGTTWTVRSAWRRPNLLACAQVRLRSPLAADEQRIGQAVKAATVPFHAPASALSFSLVRQSQGSHYDASEAAAEFL